MASLSLIIPSDCAVVLVNYQAGLGNTRMRSGRKS